MPHAGAAACEAAFERAPRLDVVIEIPRFGFRKQGSTDRVDFVSPIPCLYNYGAVPTHLGLEGDLLDALVLGPRLARGTRVRVRALGAVGFIDRGIYDDKLICGNVPLAPGERSRVLAFMRLYARGKRMLNRWRRRQGRTAVEGWCDARDAIARARPRDEAWPGPPIPF